MPDYPTPSEYQEAVQFPGTAFVDPELQDAVPRTNVLGLPQPITGAFAAVFPMTLDAGVRVAVKCFLSEAEGQAERYAAIARHLEQANPAATVGFDFQSPGIRVNGAAYPVLRMEWGKGMPLNQFVEAHREDPETLFATAEAWADLMADLEAHAMAHGDLQHGNVLARLDDDGTPRLCLVDYDTMYVPALDGYGSTEVGHRNYQHPDRTDADFGPYLDRFAALVVYLALQACALRPALWTRFDTGENLLFRDADFYAPGDSALFDALAEIDALRPLVDALRRACFVPPEDVPPLQDVQAGTAPTSVPEHRDRERTPPAPPRSRFAKALLPGAGGTVLAATGVALAGAPLVAAGLALASLVVASGLVQRQYRRLPLVRRRQRLRQEAHRFARLIATMKREIQNLQTQRQEVLDSVEERREERLEEVQEDALYDHLKHHFIGEARAVDGIRHKHVVRLKAANIRTAYEATPERIADLRTLGERTQARLRQWRATLVQQYEDEVPTELSPAEERRLQRYVQHRVDDIDAQIARTREKIEVHRVEKEQAEARAEALPELTGTRYVLYLLWLADLPVDPGRVPPTPSPRTEGTDPLPVSERDDRPWWQTHAGSPTDAGSPQRTSQKHS
jgi:hypothetical protein